MTVILSGHFKHYVQKRPAQKIYCFMVPGLFVILICNKQLLTNILYYCYESSLTEAIKAQEQFSALTKASCLFTLQGVTGVP